jgi:hypothetical protein
MTDMTKHSKTDREVLADASLDFILNAPAEAFDAYLKEAGESTDELARRATGAIASALAQHAAEPAKGEGKLATLTVEQLRSAATELGVPRSVLTAFRERRVISASVTQRFYSRLARAIGSTVEELKAAMAQPPAARAVHQYKADDKPPEPVQCTFEQLLIDTGVPPEKRAELLQDAD